MLDVVDFIWIEFRGMSVISAVVFTGIFTMFGSLFWWIQKELTNINSRITRHSERLDSNKKELTNLTVQIAVIRTVVEKTDTSIDKIIDKIYT